MIKEFFDAANGFLNSNLQHVIGFFNTEFWGLIGYTGIAAAVCIALAYFFPAMRSFAGAVFFSLGALWYGYHRGQKSKEVEIARLKRKGRR